MFLPIGDEPNPPGTPVVNYGLIAVNVAVFLLLSLPLMAQQVDVNDPAVPEYLRLLGVRTRADVRQIIETMSAYDLFVFEHGFRPAAASIVDLFASLFLHGGWLHLFGNMLFLWIYGDNVEHKLGRGRYLLTYLGCGVAATLFHAMFFSSSQMPMVGASGAISGVLGCYFLWFPKNRVKVLLVFIFFIDVVLLPARWVLLFYIVVDNVLPFVFHHGSGSVAYGAHIGGFLGGLGVAALVNRAARTGGLLGWVGHLVRGPGATSSAGVTGERSAAELFEHAIQSESWRDALQLYSELPAGERQNVQGTHALRLADWLADTGRYDTALAVLQRVIGANPEEEVLARVHLRAGLIQLYGLQVPTAAAQHFLSVLDLNPPAEVERSAREALEHIKSGGGGRGFH